MLLIARQPNYSPKIAEPTSSFPFNSRIAARMPKRRCLRTDAGPTPK
jgi:hypothetical protein